MENVGDLAKKNPAVLKAKIKEDMSNYSLEELKILNAKLSEEIEKKESASAYSKHPGGRPKKASTSYKKTELRIDKDLYYNLSILAEIDGRSTNSIICKILERYVKDPNNYQAIKTFNEYNEKSM